MRFEQKNTASIKTLFNKIAPNYDLINSLMSFGLQKRIKTAAVKTAIKHYGKTPKKVLDLCCGTGDISILFKKFCPDTDITGIDFSKEMLSIAEKKAPNIRFIQGDISQKEKFSSLTEKFDICFISFGLRNLPDVDEFLENVKILLNDGGVLAILDLGRPCLIMAPYFYLHYNIIIPLIARIFNKDIEPYKYLINSAKTYPPQKEILKKLKQHGYFGEKNKNFSFGIIATQTAKYSQIGE